MLLQQLSTFPLTFLLTLFLQSSFLFLTRSSPLEAPAEIPLELEGIRAIYWRPKAIRNILQ
jgi:hypothetical protein